MTGLLPHSLTVGPMRRPGAAAAASTRAMTSLNHRNNRTAHALITERRGDSQRDNIRITGGLRHRHRGHSCSVTCTECRGGVETVFHVGVYFRTKMHLTSWNPWNQKHCKKFVQLIRADCCDHSELFLTVQGHSRSSTFKPIENPHMISYQWLTVA